jgi:Tol biopolymer transport system component
MNRSDPQHRPFTADRLGAALDEVGAVARPDYLDDIVARAQDTRQRPTWTFPERWLPMSVAVRRERIPRTVLFALLLLLLVAAFATTVMLTGSPTRLPAPLVVTNGEIAFTSGNDIVAVRPDGSGRHVVVPGSPQESGASFSGDGGRMAYWRQNGAVQDLVVADADGSRPTTIASGVIEPTGSGIVWSPDGTRVAYSSRTVSSSTPTACPGFGTQNGDFCSSRIFVAPVDGSGTHQVGDQTLDARSPAWSPDSSTIAFGGGNATPGQSLRLYLMNADGSNVRQFSTVRGTDWAFVRTDWSHDGSKIATQASAANNLDQWDIWVIDAKTGAATDVATQVGADDIFPVWASDRDALAWAGNGLFLKEPGGQAVDVQPSGTLPYWSPDGKLIASITNDDKLEVSDLHGTVMFTADGATDNKLSWQAIRSGS